ncbi:hypothetical protein QYF61_012110 [Mycteria americana]|uniref:Uncharacterized protein n=1 Tax=Mycteria americana TaxID=33587 RepID=A0AAN7N702_MYCAM|nr:hypothetical protein QYF61_012110 [Mycteria americana]
MDSDAAFTSTSLNTCLAHSYSQHEKYQCNEERGDILSGISEGFPSISASFSFACHWTRR